MAYLLRKRAASGKRNFIEQIKDLIFLKAVLAIDIMKELQSNLEEKVNLSILAPELLGQMKPVEFFHQ